MNKIGLCCISLHLNKKNIKWSAMTRKKFMSMNRSNAISEVSKKTLNNVNVIKQTLLYCAENNWNYRISGDVMPLYTLPAAKLSYDILPDKDVIYNTFNECKKIIDDKKIRCSMHPDQYTVPASANPQVVDNAIINLKAHAEIMDFLGLSSDYNSPINIHMNSYKGYDITVIANRFISVYNALPTNVKNRLVLEIEDKKNSWNYKQLHTYIYQQTGIPITYDSHHFRLNNPDNVSPLDAMKVCAETWKSFRPLFHFSNGRTKPLDKSHSDHVTEMHKELLQSNADIDFEFKAKDDAIIRFTNKIKDYVDGRPLYGII